MATFIAPEARGVIAHSQPQYLAEHLARVFGTEEDPVNCSFFFKVGACRNGDRCGKKHNHPSASQTLLLTSLYPGTPEGICIANEQPWDEAMYDYAQAHLEAFYEEVVLVLAEYGEIEEIVVVDNTIEYMLGNVYVRYRYEECAAKALVGLTGRYYFGKLISAEYSPVADFREARCRAHHETRCTRVGACRFLHIKHIPKSVKRRVARQMYKEHPEFLYGRRGGGDVGDRALTRMSLAQTEEMIAKLGARPRSRDRGGPLALGNGPKGQGPRGMYDDEDAKVRKALGQYGDLEQDMYDELEGRGPRRGRNGEIYDANDVEYEEKDIEVDDEEL